MDFDQLLNMYLRLVVQILPLAVALASGRRLLMSRSFNGVFYAIAFLFAVLAVIGAAPGLFMGRPLEPAAIFMSLLAAPVWAIVRELCRRPEMPQYAMPVRPAFTSSREREIRTPLVLSTPIEEPANLS